MGFDWRYEWRRYSQENSKKYNNRWIDLQVARAVAGGDIDLLDVCLPRKSGPSWNQRSNQPGNPGINRTATTDCNRILALVANLSRAPCGGSGVIQHATKCHCNAEKVGNLPLFFPPITEQRTIAAFLDHEAARIDRLIEKQERLIELLKEKRQAVISHAVTKGLNLDALMKDSDVEWLGEVPAHWKIVKIGNVARVVRGGSPRPAGDKRFFGGDYMPWITVAEITKDSSKYLSSTDSMLTEAGVGRSRVFQPNTVLLSNSGATLGVPKICSIRGCANDGVVGFEKLDSEVSPDFLYWFFASLTEMYRDRIKQGAGQPNLNTTIVSRTPFALPPRDEQDRLVEWLEKSLAALDKTTKEAKHLIELAQERRSALVSAAVTGKIDVRDWTPPESRSEQTATA